MARSPRRRLAARCSSCQVWTPREIGGLDIQWSALFGVITKTSIRAPWSVSFPSQPTHDDLQSSIDCQPVSPQQRANMHRVRSHRTPHSIMMWEGPADEVLCRRQRAECPGQMAHGLLEHYQWPETQLLTAVSLLERCS